MNIEMNEQHDYRSKPDWQVILIANSFVDEVDCNSGRRRRVFNTGTAQYLDEGRLEYEHHNKSTIP